MSPVVELMVIYCKTSADARLEVLYPPPDLPQTNDGLLLMVANGPTLEAEKTSSTDSCLLVRPLLPVAVGNATAPSACRRQDSEQIIQVMWPQVVTPHDAQQTPNCTEEPAVTIVADKVARPSSPCRTAVPPHVAAVVCSQHTPWARRTPAGAPIEGPADTTRLVGAT